MRIFNRDPQAKAPAGKPAEVAAKKEGSKSRPALKRPATAEQRDAFEPSQRSGPFGSLRRGRFQPTGAPAPSTPPSKPAAQPPAPAAPAKSRSSRSLPALQARGTRSGKRAAVPREVSTASAMPAAVIQPVEPPWTRGPRDLVDALGQVLGVSQDQAASPEMRAHLSALYTVLGQDPEIGPPLKGAAACFARRRGASRGHDMMREPDRPAIKWENFRDRLKDALGAVRAHLPQILKQLGSFDSEIAIAAQTAARDEILRLAETARRNGSPGTADLIKANDPASAAASALSSADTASVLSAQRAKLVLDYLARPGTDEMQTSLDLAMSAARKSAKIAGAKAASMSASNEASRLLEEKRKSAEAGLSSAAAGQHGFSNEEIADLKGRLAADEKARNMTTSAARKLADALLAEPAVAGTPSQAAILRDYETSIQSVYGKELETFAADKRAKQAAQLWQHVRSEKIAKALSAAAKATLGVALPQDVLAAIHSKSDSLDAVVAGLDYSNPRFAQAVRGLITPDLRGTLARMEKQVEQTARSRPDLAAMAIDESSLELGARLASLLADGRAAIEAEDALAWKPTALAGQYEQEAAQARARVAELDDARMRIVGAAASQSAACAGQVSACDVRLGVLRKELAAKEAFIRRYDDYWPVDLRRATEHDQYVGAKRDAALLRDEIYTFETKRASATQTAAAAVAQSQSDLARTASERTSAAEALRCAEARAARARQLTAASPGIGMLADKAALTMALKIGQQELVGKMRELVTAITDLDVRRPEMDDREQAVAAARILVQAGDLIAHNGLSMLSDEARKSVVARIVKSLSALKLGSVSILERGDSILGALARTGEKGLFRDLLQSVAMLETAAATYRYHNFAASLGNMLSQAEVIATAERIDLDAMGLYSKAGGIALNFLPALRQSPAQELMTASGTEGTPWLITADQLRPLLKNSAVRATVLDKLASVQQHVHDGKLAAFPDALRDLVMALRSGGADPAVIDRVSESAASKLGALLPGFASSASVLQSLLSSEHTPGDFFAKLGGVLQSARTGIAGGTVAALQGFMLSAQGAGLQTTGLNTLFESTLSLLRAQPGLLAAAGLLRSEFLIPAGMSTGVEMAPLFDSLRELQSALSKVPPDSAGSVMVLGRLIPEAVRGPAFAPLKDFVLVNIPGLSKLFPGDELNKLLSTVLSTGEAARAFLEKAQAFSADVQNGRYASAGRNASEMYVALSKHQALAEKKEQLKHNAVDWIKQIPGASSIVNLDRVDEVMSDPKKVETVIQAVLDIGSAISRGDPGNGVEAIGRLADALPQERDALVGWMLGNLKGLEWLDRGPLGGLLSSAHAMQGIGKLHRSTEEGDLAGQLEAIGQIAEAAVDDATREKIAADAAEKIVVLVRPLEDLLGKPTIASLLKSNWGSIAGASVRLSDAIQKGRIVDVIGESRAILDAVPNEFKGAIAAKLFAAIGEKIPALKDFARMTERLERSGVLGQFIAMLDHMTHNKPSEMAKDLGKIMESLTTSKEGMLLLGDAMKAFLSLVPPSVKTKLLAAIAGKTVASVIPIANILVAAVGAGVELPNAIAVLNRPGATPAEKAIALAKVANNAIAAIPGAGVVSGAGDIIITLLQLAQAFDFNSVK